MEPLEENIYKITWPIFVEMLFFILLGTVDTIMLSGYSDTAVGSVGISNQILFLFGILVNIIAIGIGVVAAQYLGAKQVQNAKDTIVTGIFGNLIIGVVLSLIIIVFGKSLLILVNTDSALLDDSVIYLKIVGYSLVFISLRVALSTGFRSFSKPKIVMIIMIVGNVINVVLNAILIYGLFGAPSLGVAGAAIGTLTSRIVMVLLLVIAAYKMLGIKIHKIRFHIVQLKKILYIGIPAAAENLMWNIAQVFIVAIVNTVSVEAIIARTYILTILSFIFIFSLSLATGNSIIVGYHIGDKEHDKAYHHTLKTIRVSFFFVIIITILLNIFAKEVIGLFTDDETIIEMARSVLYFAVFIEIGRAMNLVYISALRTAGDTVYPAIIAVISMFGIAVVLSYVFAITLGMGIVGVFLATMIDELFRGSMMALRWYRKRWTVIRLIEE